MSSPLKIVYFGVRARAEAIKMTLAYGKIEYTEVSPNDYYGKEWPEARLSDEGPPFNQVPVLAVGDAEIGQSGSIVRYAASLAKAVPEDPVLAAKCDSVFETSQELAMINPIVNLMKGDDFTEKKKNFFEKTYPLRLKALARFLGDQEFFCGEKPMYCDFAVWHVMDLARLLEPTALDSHPAMLKWFERVANVEGVNGFLKSRPDICDMSVAPRLAPTTDKTTIQTTNKVTKK